jgi:hypothetical protein
MSGSVMRQLLVDITNSAAFNSLLLGELPPLLTRKVSGLAQRQAARPGWPHTK